MGVFEGKLTEQHEGMVKLNDIGFYHQYYKMKMGKKLKSEIWMKLKSDLSRNYNE